MKKIGEIALGIITSVGGFLEVGSISTALQAGVAFRYQLAWASLVGGLCLIFLIEMSGRMAAISKCTVVDALRERFGFVFFAGVFAVLSLVTFLLLVAEIGGVSVALEFVTHIPFQVWAPFVGIAAWLVLWRGTFKTVENGVSLLGLITFVFVVGAWHAHPAWGAVGDNLLPSLPHHDRARYWFLAVSILGASISPYLFYFYSAGAVEDHWTKDHLTTNRVVATVGMSFGALVAVAPLILAALYLAPQHLQVKRYADLPLALVREYGRAGLWLFSAALGIACFGAILEIALAIAYMAAQGLGWPWGENAPPAEAARFSAFYTVLLLCASILAAFGVDPLKLTILTMALSAATLPVAVLPFLVIMNDPHYLETSTNGWFGNTVVVAITLLATILAVVSLPLQVIGSS